MVVFMVYDDDEDDVKVSVTERSSLVVGLPGDPLPLSSLDINNSQDHQKKMAQKLLIVFIISTSGLKLSLDLVFFRSDMDTCLLPLEEFSKLGAQLTSCKFVQLMQIRMSKYVSSYLRQYFLF